eukprot:comp19319_c0_seq1/m.22194 comp19319_c0_seq1/g.22194  ORF comp19319_c0_seq1/g.22194 comp19319_c0_seq1/m.22194 type:complete len:250 (-) comp19319_c0_seq1:437-1186(-)
MCKMAEHELVDAGFSFSDFMWQTIGALAWAGILAYFFGLLDTPIDNLHVLLGKKGFETQAVHEKAVEKLEDCFALAEKTIRFVLGTSKNSKPSHKEESFPGNSKFLAETESTQHTGDESEAAAATADLNQQSDNFAESYEEYVIHEKTAKATQCGSSPSPKRERRGSGGSARELMSSITAGALDPILENPESGRLNRGVVLPATPCETNIQKSLVAGADTTENVQEARRKSYSEWVPIEGKIPLMAFGL